MKTTLTTDGQVVIFPSFSVDKNSSIYNTFKSDLIFARQPAGDPIADDSRILLDAQ
jgi:hypothetical protein